MVYLRVVFIPLVICHCNVNFEGLDSTIADDFVLESAVFPTFVPGYTSNVSDNTIATVTVKSPTSHSHAHVGIYISTDDVFDYAFSASDGTVSGDEKLAEEAYFQLSPNGSTQVQLSLSVGTITNLAGRVYLFAVVNPAIFDTSIGSGESNGLNNIIAQEYQAAWVDSYANAANTTGCASAGNGEISMALYEADGTTQLINSLGSSSVGQSFIGVDGIFMASTTFKIKVSESGADDLVGYAIRWGATEYNGANSSQSPSCPDAFESADDLAGGATTLTIDSASAQHTLSPASDIDWYSFAIP